MYAHMNVGTYVYMYVGTYIGIHTNVHKYTYFIMAGED